MKDLGVDYSIFDLISQGLTIDDIRLNKPVLYLRRDGETWSIARLIKRQEAEADREGPAAPDRHQRHRHQRRLDRHRRAGRHVGRRHSGSPRSARREAVVQVRTGALLDRDRARVVSRIGAGDRRERALGRHRACATIRCLSSIWRCGPKRRRCRWTAAVKHYLTTPVLDLRVSSDKVSLAEIARVVPTLAGISVQPQFEVKVDGPLDRLAVELNLRSSAGQLTGRFVADVMTPDQSVTGDVAVRHLNLAPIVKDPRQQTDLTADARVDLRARTFDDRTSLSGGVSLTAPRVVAMGYAAEHVKADATIAAVNLRARTFDDLTSLRGRVSLTASRVAAMGYAAERVKADATIKGTRMTLDGRAEAYGGSATASGSVSLPLSGAPLAYDLKGQARGLDLRRLPPALKVPPGRKRPSTPSYHVRGTEGRPTARPRFALRSVARGRGGHRGWAAPPACPCAATT